MLLFYRFFSISLLCFFSFPLVSQVEKTVAFFSKAGQLTFPSESYYFRLNSDTAGYFRSYFTKDSTLYFSGKILNFRDSSDQKNKYEGLCIWNYENGARHIVSNYNKLGLMHGENLEYYANGRVYKKQYYENGRLAGNTFMQYEENGDSTKISIEDFLPGSDTAWKFQKDPAFYGSFKLGGLFLSNNSNAIKYTLSKQKIEVGNFSGEVMTNQNYLNAESSAGIVFASNDSNYRYFFASKKRFFIGEVTNGKLNQKITEFYCEKLNAAGWNRLKFTKAGEKILYSINDFIVFTEPITSLEGNFGLGANKNTSCLFDNFSIGQSSFANDKFLESETPFDFYLSKNAHLSVQDILNGLILNKHSILVYSDRTPETINILTVLLKTDTGKVLLEGEIVARAVSNLMIVNVKAELPEPTYVFYSEDRSAEENEIISVNISRRDSTLKIHKANGILNSSAIAANFNQTFDCLVPAQNYFEKGAPVFSLKGELLGLVIKPKDFNNTDGISKAIKLNEIREFLVHNVVNVVQKKKSSAHAPVDAETLLKSTVLILVQ